MGAAGEACTGVSVSTQACAAISTDEGRSQLERPMRARPSPPDGAGGNGELPGGGGRHDAGAARPPGRGAGEVLAEEQGGASCSRVHGERGHGGGGAERGTLVPEVEEPSMAMDVLEPSVAMDVPELVCHLLQVDPRRGEGKAGRSRNRSQATVNSRQIQFHLDRHWPAPSTAHAMEVEMIARSVN